MVAFSLCELTGPVTGSKSVALLKQAGETLHLRDLFSLRSLWALGYLKLDFLALLEGFEAIALDSAIVNENVRRAWLLDKTITLRVVKPLDLTGYSRHTTNPPNDSVKQTRSHWGLSHLLVNACEPGRNLKRR